MAYTQHTVKLKAISTGGNTTKVSLQLYGWETRIIPDTANGDEVLFWNIGNGNKQLDLRIDPGAGPFVNNNAFWVKKGKKIPRPLDPAKPYQTYKYSVTADLGNGESFNYDPRFIIGRGIRPGRKRKAASAKNPGRKTSKKN